MRHNAAVDVAQSKISQIMDTLLTGISATTSGLSLSAPLARAGFSLLKTSSSAISKVRVNILQYRMHKMRNKVIPRNEFELKTFKEYKDTFSKKAAPLNTNVPPLERRLIRTEHKTLDVRITRKRKIVNRVRYKGLPSDPPPSIKEVKKIRRLNKGKVNIGPAKGMSTSKKINAFSELKIRTPGKNYSMIHREPELNIPPRAPFRQKVIRQHAWVTELKRKHGLRRKHLLPSRLSVPGLAGAISRIQQPSDTTRGAASDSLPNTGRQGPRDVKTPSRSLGRDTSPHSISPSKPIGGIIPPRRRRKKRRHRGIFIRL